MASTDREPGYTLHAPIPQSRVLIHAFTGFLDAAAAVPTVAGYLLEGYDHRLIATFDADTLLDYRARRPRLTFVTDHYASVDIPQIQLHELTDDAGETFLLLAGPEPDYRWQAFIADVIGIIDTARIDLTVGIGAVPWPAPHTRPMGVTLHGNDPELVVGPSPIVGSITIPGHVGGLLELKLGELGYRAIGTVARVPHYLAQFDYPRAAVALIESVADLTGLALPPSDDLEERAQSAQRDVETQVEGNPELQALVAALEEEVDQAEALFDGASGDGSDDESLAPGGRVPTGDEIAAQLESFLADRAAGEDQR